MTLIKGTPLRTLKQYIETRFPDHHDAWLAALPPASRELFDNPLLPSTWYSFQDGWTTPNAVMVDVCCGGNPRAAWERGRYNADTSLRGVYKVFVKIGTPSFLVKRAASLFNSMWQGADFQVRDSESNRAVVVISNVPEMDGHAEQGVAGFIERALEISGCSQVSVTIQGSVTAGHSESVFDISWS